MPEVTQSNELATEQKAPLAVGAEGQHRVAMHSMLGARRARTLRWIVGTVAPLLAVIVFGVFPGRVPNVWLYPRFQLGLMVLASLVAAATFSLKPRRLELAGALTVLPLTLAPTVAIIVDYAPTAHGLFPFFLLVAAFFVGYLLLKPAVLGAVATTTFGVVTLQLLIIRGQPFDIVGVPIVFLGIVGVLTTLGSVFRTRDEQSLMRQAEALAEQKAALKQANTDLEQEVETRTAELSSSLAWLKEEMLEHQRAQSALSASESILATFLSHLRGMAYRRRHDPQWTFLFMSSGAETFCVCNRSESDSPTSCDLAASIPPDHRKRVEAELAATAHDGGTYSVVYPISKAGRLQWVRDQGHFLRDDAGGLVLQGLLLDITREHELESQLHTAQRLEAVGRVAGGIAHDFNNLLAVVRSYVELLLEDEDLDSRRGDDLREIRLAADRAESLTRQLLAFSRRQTIAPRPVWLNETLLSMNSMLRRIVGSHVEIDYDLEQNDWPVLADPTLIEQIILNLVVNAAEAILDEGVLRIQTRNQLEEGSHRRTVRWIVADDGPGMSTHARERAFEPFFSTKEAAGGTGLGLATVYGIVTQLGGSISLETAPGEGCRFCIVLPATRAGDDERPSRLPSVPTDASKRQGDETILVVDDERAIRSAIRRILKLAGYHVLVAANSEEAVAISRSHSGPIHLLLSDVIMPDQTGIDLASRLLRERNDMRVLFVSGYAGSHLDAGQLPAASMVLQKPFSADDLKTQIRAALSH